MISDATRSKPGAPDGLLTPDLTVASDVRPASDMPVASGRPTASGPGRASTAALASAALADARVVVAAMGRLAAAAAQARQWAVADRREVLTQVRRAIDGLTTVRGSVLVAEQESGAWKSTGSGSFPTWVGTTSREGKRAGTKEIREAEQLDSVPDATAADGTDLQRAAATSPAGQAKLVAWATAQDAATFAITVARWAAALDPDGLERAHQDQRAKRFLVVTELGHGTVVKGQLDTAAGRTLILALEALDPKPAPDDTREPGQRRADALETMATAILVSPTTTPGAHVPPQVSLLLTAETFQAVTEELARRRAALTTFGFTTDDPDPEAGSGAESGVRCTYPDAPRGFEPATWEDGTPVPSTVLAQVLCDCDLTRIVVDAESVPVDLGRTQRLFTGAQRRAVIARDRHCCWPGCTMHARWCIVHHLDWWERDNGPTAVVNGVLLCRFHHAETHRRNLTITRHPRPPLDGDGGAVGVALVRYEFRDPGGRLHGNPAVRRPLDEWPTRPSRESRWSSPPT